MSNEKTAFDKYFDEQMKNPEFRAAAEKARKEIAEFDTRFNEWLAECQLMLDKHYEESCKNVAAVYKTTPAPTLEPDVLQKFVRVWSNSGPGYRSAYCFVATQDFTSKTLGEVKKGDILKPAGWKAPAKHARGNIFDKHGGMKFMGPYGVAYLK